MNILPTLLVLVAGTIPFLSYGDGPPAKAVIELGRTVFTQTAQPSCAVCHTLKAAGATGTIGPSLDDLRPDSEQILKAVRDGVGAMPAFGETLTADEIAAVASYVAWAAARDSE